MGCMERMRVGLRLRSELRNGFEAKWSSMKSITVRSSSMFWALVILLRGWKK
jgi:hypothetical protein